MSNISSTIGTPRDDEQAVFELLSTCNKHVLSESEMKKASKHQLQKSLRHTKALANRLGRYGLAFFVAWRNGYVGTPEDIIRIAKASSRQYDPRFLYEKD